MAFSASTVMRPGANNGGVDKKELFLKLFAGEVLTTFAEKNVTMGRHMVRTISHGKSAAFPATGTVTGAYFTPGDELDGGTPMKVSERVISIDDLLVAHQFVAQIDDAMNHFDVRSEISTQLGRTLAGTFDRNVLRNMILAARASATVTGGFGGTVITDADALTNADSLVQSFFDAAEALDSKDVPEEDRAIFVKPEQYYLLVNSSSKAISADYAGEANGGLASGKIYRVAGMPIVKVNHLPQADDSANTSIPAAYRANYSTVAAVVSHKSAVGTVKLIDLATETEWDIRRQGWWLVAKYAVGHGILRPESAVEIKTA